MQPYARRVLVLVVCAVVSLGLFAKPREERPIRDPREKSDPVTKIIKRIVKSLGDGLIVPTP